MAIYAQDKHEQEPKFKKGDRLKSLVTKPGFFNKSVLPNSDFVEEPSALLPNTIVTIMDTHSVPNMYLVKYKDFKNRKAKSYLQEKEMELI